MTVTGEGVVFVNPRSGREHTSSAELAAQFPEHRVEETPVEGLDARIRAAIADGAAFIGMPGGDGTIRSGTRNHIARHLGIVDFPAAVRASEGRIEAVDVGEVNGGHCFINNSAIGKYPPDGREARGFQRRVAHAGRDVAGLTMGQQCAQFGLDDAAAGREAAAGDRAQIDGSEEVVGFHDAPAATSP